MHMQGADLQKSSGTIIITDLHCGQALLSVALLDADVNIVHTRGVLFLLSGVGECVCSRQRGRGSAETRMAERLVSCTESACSPNPPVGSTGRVSISVMKLWRRERGSRLKLKAAVDAVEEARRGGRREERL